MELKDQQCKPCEGGIEPMFEAEEEQYLQSIPSWSLNRDSTHRISKDFKFKTFPQAIQFVKSCRNYRKPGASSKFLCELYCC